MKKTLSILLSFIMLLSVGSVAGVSAFAEPQGIGYDENPTVFYEYDKTTKTLTISGEGEYMTDQGDEEYSGDGGVKFDACSDFYKYRKTAKNVVFEEGIVNVGGGSFSKFEKLKTVQLPETITRIEAYAFESCTQLEEIILPDSLTRIGFEAFAGCRKLKSLNIPKNVKEIANGFIFDTPELAQLTVSEENEHFKAVDNVLYNKEMTKLYAVAPKQETVTIPETVTEIADLAFALSNVKNIVIPKSVKILGGGAFFKSKLETITFEDGCQIEEIKTIDRQYGDEAEEYYGTFEDCVNLKKLVLPESVKSFGRRTLGGCKSLEYLYIGKNLESFGTDNFYACKNLKKIEVNKENKDFYTYQNGFYGKRYDRKVFIRFFGSRKNAKLRQDVQSIDSFAFKDTKVEKVTIPKTVVSVGSAVFYNAKNLRSVRFAKEIKLKYIGWDYVSFDYRTCRYEKPELDKQAMFYNCNKLKSIQFPDSLKATEGRIFENCKNLKTIKFGKKFNYNSGNIYYYDYFTYFAKNCPKIKKITFSKKNPRYTTKNGIVYSKDKVTMLYYPKGAKAKTFVVPKGVKHIEGGVFKNCKHLKRVKFVYDYENKKDCWFSSDTFGKNITILIKKNSWAHREVKRMKENFSVKIKYKFY